MPAIAKLNSSSITTVIEVDRVMTLQSEKKREEAVRSVAPYTPRKRKLRSDASPMQASPVSTPMKLKSPRRSLQSSPNSTANGNEKDYGDENFKLRKTPIKNLFGSLNHKPNWNPRDSEHVRMVKEALHVSTSPSVVVCREDEQNRILDFCKACIEQEKAGSLYVCGCPGTGKSLAMEKVKQLVVDWTQETGFRQLDVLLLNCTSLTNANDIFSKILGNSELRKRSNCLTSPLQVLQNMYSRKPLSPDRKMKLIIADELDYLITKNHAVLHDLFMLTTLPFSRCILIGVANAIDLADRFLPRLQALNCKPAVITFRAYSKDQIMKILQERLAAIPYTIFQPQALELCARRVSAAFGDMRKVLSVCRSAIEIVEAELRESSDNLNLSMVEKFVHQPIAPLADVMIKQGIDVVRIEHMASALSKTFRSPVVDTIQVLPQHQQVILCSSAKLFRGGKKDTTLGELNKFYIDICKSAFIPPAGIFELSSMCKVLHDQGLLKLGQAREDKLKRVTLKVDEADITFALQGIRFFRNFLQ